MIAACCVKAAQTVNRMRALVDEGITEKDWTEALIKKSFEEPIAAKPDDTPLTMVLILGVQGVPKTSVWVIT